MRAVWRFFIISRESDGTPSRTRAVFLDRRDDAVYEHLEFARGAEFAGQPFELGFNRSRLRIAQKTGKQRHRCAQAAEAYTHLMNALGIAPEHGRLVADDLPEAGNTNRPESVARNCIKLKVDRRSLDRRILRAIDEFVSALRFAFDGNAWPEASG